MEFVAARGDALLRVAALMCGARQDAEDILQTALEKAYRHWGGWRPAAIPSRTSAGSWSTW